MQVAKGKIYDTKNGRGPKSFPTKTNGNCIELLEKKRLSELPRHPNGLRRIQWQIITRTKGHKKLVASKSRSCRDRFV